MKTSKYARDQWAIVRTKLIGSTTKAETDIDTNGGSEDVSAETTTPNGKAKKKATPRKRKSGMYCTLECLSVMKLLMLPLQTPVRRRLQPRRRGRRIRQRAPRRQRSRQTKRLR